jgi:tetratricopeptide (TPR) repeat protein
VAQATGTVGEGLEVDLPVVESGADAANALAEGDLARALEEFRIVLRQQPDNLTALNNVGQILVRLQRPAEAVPVLERAVAISPDTWMLRFNLARAQGEAGIWSRAAEQYRAASELMPEHYPTLFNLGIALKKAGQPEAAAGALAQAAALDATQADPWLPLATTLEGLGRPEEARQAYEKFLNLSPESPERAKVEQHLARSKESGAGKAAATAAQAATAEQKPSGG